MSHYTCVTDYARRPYGFTGSVQWFTDTLESQTGDRLSTPLQGLMYSGEEHGIWSQIVWVETPNSAIFLVEEISVFPPVNWSDNNSI